MSGRRGTSRRALLGGAAALIGERFLASGASSQEFTGIRILIPDTALRPTIETIRADFEAESGVALSFVPAPPETVEFALREDARSGVDELHGAIVPMWHIGGYIVDDIIRPLDELLDYAGAKIDLDLSDELPAVRQLRTFGDDLMALPIDGDSMLLYYQVGHFADEALQRDFESETGKILVPPTTWEKLLDIATWWSARGESAVALHMASAGSGVMQFLGMAASYAVDAGEPGAFWFDSATFAPAITSDRHVEALEAFQRLVSTGAPEQIGWYLPDAWSAFLDGDALFTIAGPDLLTSAIARGHPRHDRIGIAALPGMSADERIGNTLGPCWGGVVRSSAPEPELVFRALALLSETLFQRDRGWTVDDGIDPARVSQLPPEAIDGGASTLESYMHGGFGSKQALEFTSAIAETLSAPVQLPYLRIPGAYDYYIAFDQRLRAFVAGDIPVAAEALAQIAGDFEALSALHGLERQQHLYQLSLQ